MVPLKAGGSELERQFDKALLHQLLISEKAAHHRALGRASEDGGSVLGRTLSLEQTDPPGES